MAVSKTILGMNARNFLYIRKYNLGKAKSRADDKLATKELLIKHHLATPELLAGFSHTDDIKHFDWKLPADGFAIKPARGYGGGGILVIKSWNGIMAVAASGEAYSKKQLQSHLFDIFDGAYSLQFLPDKAYIERLVHPAPYFKKIGSIGVPDIRVIVFRKIPVMAMLRLPTSESRGKANLHLGAIGVGIDIRTGITTHALYKNRVIKWFPQTKKKISGIKIPQWQEILLLASRVADISKLGYAGVDMVIDEKEGPLVLEVNARPGLGIQIANLTSLRTRLERVEDMAVATPQRGVEVAQSIFSEAFSEHMQTSPKVLTVIQPITVYGSQTKGTAFRKETNVLAKLDSGAYRTSIDRKLAEELHLPIREEKVYVQSASGRAHRNTVRLTFKLANRTIKTIASVVDRSHLKFPIIVGRIDLQGFLVQPDYGDYPDEGKIEKSN
ncbi:MAG: sugar-transfer associated ATP-grasp domain-containing protein [Patescibacteria group bacterium]